MREEVRDKGDERGREDGEEMRYKGEERGRGVGGKRKRRIE